MRAQPSAPDDGTVNIEGYRYPISCLRKTDGLVTAELPMKKRCPYDIDVPGSCTKKEACPMIHFAIVHSRELGTISAGKLAPTAGLLHFVSSGDGKKGWQCDYDHKEGGYCEREAECKFLHHFKPTKADSKKAEQYLSAWMKKLSDQRQQATDAAKMAVAAAPALCDVVSLAAASPVSAAAGAPRDVARSNVSYKAAITKASIASPTATGSPLVPVFEDAAKGASGSGTSHKASGATRHHVATFRGERRSGIAVEGNTNSIDDVIASALEVSDGGAGGSLFTLPAHFALLIGARDAAATAPMATKDWRPGDRPSTVAAAMPASADRARAEAPQSRPDDTDDGIDDVLAITRPPLHRPDEPTVSAAPRVSASRPERTPDSCFLGAFARSTWHCGDNVSVMPQQQQEPHSAGAPCLHANFDVNGVGRHGVMGPAMMMSRQLDIPTTMPPASATFGARHDEFWRHELRRRLCAATLALVTVTEDMEQHGGDDPLRRDITTTTSSGASNPSSSLARRAREQETTADIWLGKASSLLGALRELAECTTPSAEMQPDKASVGSQPPGSGAELWGLPDPSALESAGLFDSPDASKTPKLLVGPLLRCGMEIRRQCGQGVFNEFCTRGLVESRFLSEELTYEYVSRCHRQHDAASLQQAADFLIASADDVRAAWGPSAIAFISRAPQLTVPVQAELRKMYLEHLETWLNGSIDTLLPSTALTVAANTAIASVLAIHNGAPFYFKPLSAALLSQYEERQRIMTKGKMILYQRMARARELVVRLQSRLDRSTGQGVNMDVRSVEERVDVVTAWDCALLHLEDVQSKSVLDALELRDVPVSLHDLGDRELHCCVYKAPKFGVGVASSPATRPELTAIFLRVTVDPKRTLSLVQWHPPLLVGQFVTVDVCKSDISADAQAAIGGAVRFSIASVDTYSCVLRFPPQKFGTAANQQDQTAPWWLLNFESYLPGRCRLRVKFEYNTWYLRSLAELRRHPSAQQFLSQLESKTLVSSCVSKEMVTRSKTLARVLHERDHTLDAEQDRFLGKVLGRPRLAVLWGPPGTGKTHSLAVAIATIVRCIKGSRVLAMASSTYAVNLLARRLRDLGVRVARVFTASTSPYDLKRTDKDLFSIANPVVVRRLTHSFRIEYPAANDVPIDATFENVEPQALLDAEVTLITVGHCQFLSHHRFHAVTQSFAYVFLDECGQVTTADMLAPITFVPETTTMVVAGDPLQLGPKVVSSLAGEMGFGESFLHQYMDLCRESPTVVTEMLTVCYRCPPQVLRLFNDMFYENALRAPMAPPTHQASATHRCSLLSDRSQRVIFIDVKPRLPHGRRDPYSSRMTSWQRFGEEASLVGPLDWAQAASAVGGGAPTKSIHPTSTTGASSTPAALTSSGGYPAPVLRYSNEAEVDVVHRLVRALVNEFALAGSDGLWITKHPGDSHKIGIATPYKQHVMSLQTSLLFDGLAAYCDVGTVDQLQGREFPIVIVTVVRPFLDTLVEGSSAPLGFVGDDRKTNVAISRAKGLLFLVGDGQALVNEMGEGSYSSRRAAAAVFGFGAHAGPSTRRYAGAGGVSQAAVDRWGALLRPPYNVPVVDAADVVAWSHQVAGRPFGDAGTFFAPPCHGDA